MASLLWPQLLSLSTQAARGIGGKLKNVLGGLVRRGQGGGSDAQPEETLDFTDQMPMDKVCQGEEREMGCTEFNTTAGHWPFSKQFSIMANQI